MNDEEIYGRIADSAVGSQSITWILTLEAIGQLLTATVPYVQWPHGVARIAPVSTPGMTDRYLADKIYGFSVGPSVLMTSTGDVGTNRAKWVSDFDYDLESATPYYAADLRTCNIRTEFTATPEATYYRFTFPSSAHAIKVTTGSGRTLCNHVTTSVGSMPSNDRRAHFGLGAEAKIDHLEIRWPSRIVQRLEHPTLDRFVNVDEPI